MGKRGPKSHQQQLAELTGPIEIVGRPDAPYDLTDAQSRVWQQVVDSVPADWFSPENYALLGQYCRHVVSAQRVAQLIAEIEAGTSDLDVAEYDRLLKMQEREGRAMSSLATRMRITQQSVHDREKLRESKTRTKKPWDVD